ncbi:MAG: hypothetical protein U1F76_30505 [Candidatus Competibacteraceae bacterium]
MSDITMSDFTDLADRKVREVAKRVLHTVLIASEKAVASQAEPSAYPMPTDPKGLEKIFLDRFNSLDADKRQAATIRVMRLVKAPAAERKRYFDDLSAVDLRSPHPVVEQVKALPFPQRLKFPLTHLQNLPLHGGILSAGLVPMQTTNKLEFRIHKVRCIDETNPEWFGDDEIALGGTTVDESGDTNKVSEFTVRNDFDDGEQQVYSPPKQFTWFNLREGTKWPKSYFVTLVLAEKDMGGLADYLNNLLDAVKGYVIEALTAALGAAIGASGGPVGAIIGGVVGWVVAKAIEWLKEWWGDDIFEPRTVSVSIPSRAHRWPGGRTDSLERVVRFMGYGGTYDVTYDWRLFS